MVSLIHGFKGQQGTGDNRPMMLRQPIQIMRGFNAKPHPEIPARWVPGLSKGWTVDPTAGGSATLANTDGVTWSSAQTAAFRSKGKLYCEFFINAGTASWYLQCGVAPMANQGWLGGKGVAYQGVGGVGQGQIYHNNVQIGASSAYGSISDTIMMALDLNAMLIWFAVNNGNWNGSTSNNPATGVGGLRLDNGSGMCLPLAPAIASQSNGAWTVTLRTRLPQFTYSVPNGYRPWDM